MKRHYLTFGLPLIIVAALAGSTGYWLAQPKPTSMTATTLVAEDSNGERKVLYWYDPMMPNQHFDQPGKSPFMDMALVPKYADEAGMAGGVQINPALIQNLGIRYATVQRGKLSTLISAPANVVFNERDVAVVQTRTAGFVERVYARAPGDVITRGAPLVDILVPEWASAQAEYLALRQSGDADLVAAGKERLRFLGMPERSIAQMEKAGQPTPLFTITAPLAGVIQSLDIRQGMTVSPDMTVARINGLASVWLEANVAEAQGANIRPGQPVMAQFTALPNQDVEGQVIAILPELNTQSRTLRVRMELPNPQHQFRPGMFAQVRLESGESAEALIIPSEALIRTGKRTVVIVAEADGRFRPIEVTPGAQADDKTAILSGLSENQKVVTSGQFLIDSEASLRSVLAQMQPTDAMVAETPADKNTITGQGVIEAVAAGEITLSHEPIPALDWPAMTMPFTLAKGVSTKGLKPAQRVQFVLEKHNDEMVITRLDVMEGMQ